MSYKHILAAVDLTSSSQNVIDKAISLAKGGNSKLSLVFVDVDRVVLEPKDKHSLEEKLKTLADQSDYPIPVIIEDA